MSIRIVDVSGQENLDFHSLLAAGAQAVVVNAGKGQEVSRDYAQKHMDARNAGLVFGATYKKGTDTGNPVADADFFVNNALLEPGDFVLVEDELDLHDAWTESFVGRIHERTGVWAVLAIPDEKCLEDLATGSLLRNCDFYVSTATETAPPAVEGFKIALYKDKDQASELPSFTADNGEITRVAMSGGHPVGIGPQDGNATPPTANPAPAPTLAGADTVTQDESLQDTALRHGTTVEALKQANPELQEEEGVSAGDTVQVPGSSVASAPVSGPTVIPNAEPGKQDKTTYTVQASDDPNSLTNIASKLAIPFDTLKEANPDVKLPLVVGDVINVPGFHAGAEPVPSNTPTAEAARKTVKAEQGDTLETIAAREGIAVGDLQIANPQVTGENPIYPEQLIVIPQGG